MSTPHQCPICGGTGKITPVVSTGGTAPDNCHSCGGSGVLWDMSVALSPWDFTHALPGQLEYTPFALPLSPEALRDWFAGQALPGLLATPAALKTQAKNRGVFEDTIMATAAYEIADAMLAERAKPKGA